MLGKPQDCSLACKFSGTCFGHLSPDTHPKGRGDATHHGTHLMSCGSCRETLPSPGLCSAGTHMWGQVQSLCKARGVWWKKAAPIPGGLTVTAGLVPPRDSHCSVSVLSPLLVLPTPAALAGSRQSSRHSSPGPGPSGKQLQDLTHQP